MEYDVVIEKIFRKFPEMMKPSKNLPIGDKKVCCATISHLYTSTVVSASITTDNSAPELP